MENNIAIQLENISMHFNMTTEKIDNLKEYFIKMVKGQLFYKDFVAVENVSLQIKKGEVFGIVGTNGSGKSTLLKIIAGILKPTTGTVMVDGNIAPLIELGAGFDGELTAHENIYLNGSLLGYDKKFIDQHFNAIMDFAELWEFLEVPIKNYSSGMVSRIAFAISTVIEPDILIVDEILSVGDFLFQQKCMNRIRTLMDKGITVIIVSHSIDLIETLCDRVMWIEKSQVKMVGRTWQVCNAYRNLQNEGAALELQKQLLDTVAVDKCYVCGNETEFRVDHGVTLMREGICKYCASSVRISDLVGAILKTTLQDDSSLSEQVENLAQYKILNISFNKMIDHYMSVYPNYYSYDYDKNIHGENAQDLVDLPFDDGFFDIIITEEIVKHFSNNKQSFLEIHRLLKNNGVHYFTTPIHEGRATKSRDKLPPIYLNGPTKSLLVHTDWGDDTCELIDQYGFRTKMEKEHDFYDNQDITNVDETYEECLSTHPFYYYKYNSIVFISQKQ